MAQLAGLPVRPQTPRLTLVAGNAPAPAHHQALLQAVLLVVAGGFVVLAQLSRPAGSAVTRTLWAEDGAVFLGQAYLPDSPSLWLTPYAGYVHLVPRMLASAVAQLPTGQAAFWVALLSAMVVAACLICLAIGLRTWLPEPWMPAALVVALGSLDGVVGETAANLANLHWFGTVALIGLLLLTPRSAAAAAVAAIASLALASSTAFSIPLAGVAVVGVIVRWQRDGRPGARRALPVALAVCGGAAVQLVATLRDPRPDSGQEPPSAAQTAEWFLEEVVGRAVYGMSPVLWQVVLTIAGVVVLTAVATVSRQDLRRDRAVVASCLTLASIAVFTMNVQLNAGISDRYAALPAMLLVTAWIVALGGRGTTHRVLIGLVSLALLLSAASSWAVSFPARGAAEDFADQIATGATRCRSGSTVEIAITPPSWTMAVPCGEARE